MKNLTFLIILFSLSLKIYGQHSPDLQINELEIIKNIKENSTAITNNNQSTKFATVFSGAFNNIYEGQSLTSVTNQLGTPSFKIRIIDLQTGKIHPTSNWNLIYYHTESNQLYYKMLFSGNNNQPDRLINVEAFFLIEGQRISVGILKLK